MKKTEKRGEDRNSGVRFNWILFIGMKINRVERRRKKEKENKT